MIRTILLTSILATPAHAADRGGWAATTVTLAPSDGPAVATVTIRNEITPWHDPQVFDLEIDGLSVVVEYLHTSGEHNPDRVTVAPPDGFIAVPPEVDVPEGGEAVIAIYEGLSS